MPLKPHRKRYGFEAFTRCQSHRFQLLKPISFPGTHYWGRGSAPRRRGTPLFGLYGDVPLDRVWFLAPLPWTGTAFQTGYGCKTVVEYLAIRNQRRLSVFFLVNNASRQLSFHLRITDVHAKFWDVSPSLLGNELFYLLWLVFAFQCVEHHFR